MYGRGGVLFPPCRRAPSSWTARRARCSSRCVCSLFHPPLCGTSEHAAQVMHVCPAACTLPLTAGMRHASPIWLHAAVHAISACARCSRGMGTNQDMVHAAARGLGTTKDLPGTQLAKQVAVNAKGAAGGQGGEGGAREVAAVKDLKQVRELWVK